VGINGIPLYWHNTSEVDSFTIARLAEGKTKPQLEELKKHFVAGIVPRALA
jgi:hypothetical protein